MFLKVMAMLIPLPHAGRDIMGDAKDVKLLKILTIFMIDADCSPRREGEVGAFCSG